MSFIGNKELDATLRKFKLNQSRLAALVLVVCLFAAILFSQSMHPALAVIMGFVYFPIFGVIALFFAYWAVFFIAYIFRKIFSGWNEGFEKQDTVDYYDPDC